MTPSDKKTPRVTLKDISRLTGVALSTVSNALTGKSYVREDTKALVLRVAREQGYRSSPIARTMRTGRTYSIGLLVTDITNMHYAEVMRGAETTLRSHGYFLLVGNSDHNAEIEAQYVQHFIDQQVDGIIIAIHSMESESVSKIQDAGIPLILLNRRHESVINDLVGVDYRVGLQTGLRHLWSMGHRSIAVMVGKPDSSVTSDRLDEVEAFKRSVGEAHIDLHVMNVDYSLSAGYDATKIFLSQAPDITAFVTSLDQSAYGCLSALRDCGKRVPEDCSVIGFDDMPLSGSSLVNLTTLRVDHWTLGEMAANLLLARIRKTGGAAKTELLLPQIVIRGTTAPPAGQQG